MNICQKETAKGSLFLPAEPTPAENNVGELFSILNINASKKHKCLMKSVFKLKYLPVFALVLGGGLAVATTERPSSSLNVEWRRNQHNEWSLGTGTCISTGTTLCRGTFPVGYDPNDSTNAANEAHTLSEVQYGYVP